MALDLRPNCECCDKDLPPSSPMARICSYECTFCADCVEGVLFNVCHSSTNSARNGMASRSLHSEATAFNPANRSFVQPG